MLSTPTGGGLKLQALISHSPGGWTSTITMPAGSVSGGAPPPRCPSSRRALAWRDKEYVLVPSRRSRPPRNLTTSKRSHARGGASGATDWLRGDSFRRRLWARGGHRAPCASQSPPHTCHVGLHCPCRVESPRPDPGRDPAGGAPSVLLAMRKSHASEPRVS